MNQIKANEFWWIKSRSSYNDWAFATISFGSAINLKFSNIVMTIYSDTYFQMFACKSTVCRKLKCFSFAGMKNYAKYQKRLGLCNNLQFCLPSTSTNEFMISCVLGFGGGWILRQFHIWSNSSCRCVVFRKITRYEWNVMCGESSGTFSLNIVIRCNKFTQR